MELRVTKINPAPSGKTSFSTRIICPLFFAAFCRKSIHAESAERSEKAKERVVHQGLGWFLREAWKVHPGPVEAFLLKWKEDAARLIFQYATEKMAKEERVRFRREK